MTEKKAEPAYILTEGEPKTISEEVGFTDSHKRAMKAVRSRPHNPAPERVMLCFGDYWECPIDEEECNVSDPCHRKAIRDREHDEQVKREAREEVFSFIRDFIATHVPEGGCPFGKMNSEECLDVRDGQCEICIIDHAIESLRTGGERK